MNYLKHSTTVLSDCPHRPRNLQTFHGQSTLSLKGVELKHNANCAAKDKTYYIVVRVGMGGIGMGGFPVVNVLRAFVFSAVNNTLVHTLSPLILYFNYKFFLKYFSA